MAKMRGGESFSGLPPQKCQHEPLLTKTTSGNGRQRLSLWTSTQTSQALKDWTMKFVFDPQAPAEHPGGHRRECPTLGFLFELFSSTDSA